MVARRFRRTFIRWVAGSASALVLSGCALIEKEFGAAAETPPPPDQREIRIAALESELAIARAEKDELAKKLAALEKEAAVAAVVADTPPIAPPSLKEAPTAALAQPQLPPAPEINPEAVVAAADADTALAQAPAKPVESSPRLVQPSFASTEETTFENEAAGMIRTASVLFGVHLASYRHAEEARAGWKKLQREFPNELGLLEPRLEAVMVEGRGEFLRLIGGGFSSEDKAAALCASLKTRGAYCAVAGFEGIKLSLADPGAG